MSSIQADTEFGFGGDAFGFSVKKDSQTQLWYSAGFVSGIVMRQTDLDTLLSGDVFKMFSGSGQVCDAFPIRGVILKGKNPVVKLHLGTKKVFLWVEKDVADSENRNNVDSRIFSKLRAKKIDTNQDESSPYYDSAVSFRRLAIYPTPESAKLDLEQSALAVFREKAGLPVIPWNKESWCDDPRELVEK
jgi:hypothetical protein